MNDPVVLDNRNVVMQRIQDAVARGYTQHCSGVVQLEKVARFIQRMSHLYFVFDSRFAKARARQAGMGNSVLILARYNNSTEIHFWLLVTPPEHGAHPAHALERLQDALSADGRINIDGYELVRRIRGTLSREPARPRWTWRMDANKYGGWRNSIVEMIRQRAPRAKVRDRMLALFSSTPGFSGARQQVGKLASLYRSEWRRRRGNEAVEPLPVRLSYVRRLPNTGKRLRSITSSSRRMS